MVSNLQHFDTASRVVGGEGFAFVVSGCGKECNNPAQPANATEAWNFGCNGDDATCDVVQSYRYNSNTSTRVNSSFVSMRVQVQSGYNRPCAQQYVGKYQSCTVISGRCACRRRGRRSRTCRIEARSCTMRRPCGVGNGLWAPQLPGPNDLVRASEVC